MATPLSFNAAWYLAQNPDVAAAIESGAPFNAFEHFMLYGRTEGRSGSPLFDPQQYLADNPDVAAAVAQGLITAWDHFELFGGDEGRTPSPLFDADFYLQQNPDVAAAIEQGQLRSAVQHFILFGQGEPRAINPALDLGRYTGVNPDIAQAAANGLNVLEHLLQYGVYEGRNLGNGVSLSGFSSDPGFTQAQSAGNATQAMMRVESVAPFMPTFERPSGWTPPADTPIPVDFVPPAGSGIRLVVPPEVIVPPDIVLPDVFDPVTPEPTPTPVPPAPTPDPIDPDPPAPLSFTVSNTAGVLGFGGTATGDITFTVASDGVATFSRGGLTALTTPNVNDITSAGGATIKLSADVVDLSVAHAAKLVAITGFDANGKVYGLKDAAAAFADADKGALTAAATTLLASNPAVELTDDPSLGQLRSVNQGTTGAITLANYSVSFEGMSSDMLQALDGISGYAGALTVSDTTLPLADLKALETTTSGLVNASTVTSTTGVLADATLVLVTKAGTSGDTIQMNGAVAVTVTDTAGTAVAAADLAAVGGATAGAVAVSEAVDISGTGDQVMAALVTPDTRVTAASANVTITDLGAAPLDLSGIATTGSRLAITPVSATLNSATDLGDFRVMVANFQTLTMGLDQANNKLIVSSGVDADNGALKLTGTVNRDVNLETIQMKIHFGSIPSTPSLKLGDGGRVIVNAVSVTEQRLYVEGTSGGSGVTEVLQVQGTAADDKIDLRHFSSADALVTVAGLGGADEIILDTLVSGDGDYAVTQMMYHLYTEGGTTGDVIREWSGAVDTSLAFKQADFGGAGVHLAGAGTKSVAVNASASAKANLGSLGDNFNGVIRISDNAAADFNNVAAVSAEAIQAAETGNGINAILLIDNGTDSRFYFWNDGSGGSADSIVETNELTLIGTLKAVTDATTVGAVLFGSA